MPLDDQTKGILDAAKEMNAPALYEMGVEGARVALREMTFPMDTPRQEVAKREERTIPGPAGEIPVRIYWPEDPATSAPRPILLLFHGGGWTIGDMDTHENMSRFYCNEAGLIVINVDYRLAPEHKFPVGVEDCYAALTWAAQNADEIGGDATRIAVTGDSAGGNLSAALCLMARDRGGPAIAFQALTYPAVDSRMDAYDIYPSRTEFAEGYFLTRNDMDWLYEMYFADPKDASDTRCSPMLSTDLAGLPPALVVTAGFDPLRDEGKAYADRLAEAGVPVEHTCFETTIHGFYSFSGALEVGREGLALTADRLAQALQD